MWAGLELQNSSQLTKWRTQLPSAASLRQASLLLGAPRQPAENQAAEQLVDDDREESDNEGDCLPSFRHLLLYGLILHFFSEIILRLICIFVVFLFADSRSGQHTIPNTMSRNAHFHLYFCKKMKR